MFILLMTSADGLSVMPVCLSTCRPLPPPPQQAAIIAVPEEGGGDLTEPAVYLHCTYRTVTQVVNT
jgi:hypothetical protein